VKAGTWRFILSTCNKVNSEGSKRNIKAFSVTLTHAYETYKLSRSKSLAKAELCRQSRACGDRCIQLGEHQGLFGSKKTAPAGAVVSMLAWSRACPSRTAGGLSAWSGAVELPPKRASIGRSHGFKA